MRILETRIEHIRRNIIGSFAVNRISIDYDFKFFIFQVEINSSDSKRNCFFINFFFWNFLEELNIKVINIRLTDSIRPPKFRVLNMDIMISVLFTSIQGCNFYLVLINLIFIVGKTFRVIWKVKCYRKVDNCFLLCDCSCSCPDVVYFDLIVGLKIYRLPYSSSIEIRSPVPRVLVACFSGVSILERHTVGLLSFLVIEFGGIDSNFQIVGSLFQNSSNMNGILPEGIAGFEYDFIVESY